MHKLGKCAIYIKKIHYPNYVCMMMTRTDMGSSMIRGSTAIDKEYFGGLVHKSALP